MKPTRALVLSGGGARGAFQVGVISRLAHDYDIFTGISVGALNAGYLAQFKNTQEGILSLIHMWNRTDTRSIYKKWFGGLLAALWKPSVYNSEPLQEMVRDHISVDRLKTSRKNLTVGAVEIPSGRYRSWTETDAEIINGILASSAFPAMLTPVKSKGRMYLDGGLRTVTPIADAIRLGATHVDVVMCSDRQEQKHVFPKNPNALKIATNSLEILMSEIIHKDLKVAHLYNRLAGAGLEGDKREISIRIIRPPYELGDPLDFSPDKIQEEMALGAKEVIRGWQTLEDNLEVP